MQVFFVIAYFIIGFVQLFAIADGAGHAFRVGGFASFIIAAFLTYIPIVGAGFGVYGAVTAWGWPIWQALILFFWYVIAAVVVSIVQGVAGR
ncbi:hypothetical protein [Mesorhizobium sp. LSHC412B00]|uniref:hypothetical protein n=1 Tax=Mesorhizobium sp. LSHC412B00 TaxID=1287285 RepID=UPI0003CF9229|nr:hypothetical protein [Mesorhizobium sp. LSHC412B00]ESX85292.1 membrane protein [Mesorhizobium sp. LSHC412B00]